MPHIKNALIRYRIIDKCIRNKYKPHPSKEELRIACEEALFGSSSGDHICDSTIEKDIFAMRMDHDAPISYSKKDKGYYYTDPEYTIDNIPLTDDDMDAISFAAKTLMQFKDVDLFRQFGSAIDKIMDRVTVSADDDAAKYIQFEQSKSSGGNEFLAPLLEAIKNCMITEFNYASFVSGIKKKRSVVPLLLKEYRNRWYLITFDPDKSGYITYALDRIEELNVTPEKTERPKDFNPDNFFKYSIGITSGQILPMVVLLEANKVAAKYLESQPLHLSQEVVKTNNEKTVFTLKVGMSEELIRELLSYGGEVRVLQPAELRNEIKRRAEKILQ